MFEIEHYLTETDRNPFAEWYEGLKDVKAKRAIDRRLIRMALGNFGDYKHCGDGVWELRIDLGPGYRIYWARNGEKVLLLLAGDDKRTQQADIAKARMYWQQFQQNQSEKRQ